MNSISKYYDLTPEDCLKLSFEQSFKMLENIISSKELKKAFDISNSYESPLKNYKNTDWSKTAKIIGINPYITKDFWGIVKYAMTFPEDCIHIMPLWESGDGSLYVQNSWRLNNDFLSEDLLKKGYSTIEDQLKITVNLLHAMGKIVGFDCLPHVDNFSEIVITNPKMFEWVKLNESKTSQIFDVEYDNLYKDVEKIIINELNAEKNLFDMTEDERDKIIFPIHSKRYQQRMRLRKAIRDNGFEPIPVVEHSPARPIIFDKIDYNGVENWATFKVENKNAYAKIFGGITPYKWYKIDKNGYPIKNTPQSEVWDYFVFKINEFQKKYNFDFLRGDMAHNQISHSHGDDIKDINNHKELWRKLKEDINKSKPYFATFAEAFYNTYYIDGLNDMENKNFDIVLGNMNFNKINTEYFNWLEDFLNPFRANFSFSPCVTVFTNDGDTEEHKYLFNDNAQNKMRYFISLFLNLPSYMGIGFETKSLNPQNSNEFSNPYITKQPKEYIFGDNLELFEFITQMRNFYLTYKDIIQQGSFDILDFGNNDILGWCYDEEVIFIVTIEPNQKIEITNYEKAFENENCKIFQVCK